MTTVSDIYTRVSRELIDPEHRLWTTAALLDYLNDALASIIMVRPDLSREIVATTIEADTLRVALGSTDYKLLSVNHCNDVGLTFIPIEELNRLAPTWRTERDSQPLHWSRNADDELSFFLYPAPDQQVSLEYECSKAIRVQSEEDVFPLPELYEGLVFDYMMYRAYSKEGQSETERAKANTHFQSFTLALTGKSQADKGVANAPTQ